MTCLAVVAAAPDLLELPGGVVQPRGGDGLPRKQSRSAPLPIERPEPGFTPLAGAQGEEGAP
jgi:hypothetical protein